MLGYTVRDPQSRTRVQLLSFQNSPHTPERWQPEPTIAERITHSGRMVSVGPKKFSGSGLTRAAWRGVREVFAESFEDRISATVRALRSGANLAYFYWAELDHVGHGAGWASDEWTAELERVDAGLALLARRLPRGTALIVTADHGMINISKRLDFASCPLAGNTVTAGEERFLHIYTDGAEDAAQAVVQEWVGEAGTVLTRDEVAVRLAPVRTGHAERIGDLVIAAAGRWGISDSRWMSDGQMNLTGAHGSVTDDERDIPLITEVT